MTDDIDPDRKFSNPSDWGNSIDLDDASDGSDGGYTLHANYIVPDAMKELIQLRIDNYNIINRVEELKDVLYDILSYGCPICKGDCSGSNVPVMNCPYSILKD